MEREKGLGGAFVIFKFGNSMSSEPQQKKRKMESKMAITLTFGDQAENHVGMEKIGKMADDGFDLKDFMAAKEIFEAKGGEAELIDLRERSENAGVKGSAKEAYVLILRGGVNVFLKESMWTADDCMEEQASLEVDKKAFMYGRVVDKKARHNLCFGDAAQEPQYENGKGRIVAYSDVPILNAVREAIPSYLGNKGESLVAEGNYYYDPEKCGIGFHGDAERKRVVALRLGASIPFHYQWFLNGKAVGKRVKLRLEHGDVYVMSEKATGFDWRKKLVHTLRHAAGCDAYLKIDGSLG